MKAIERIIIDPNICHGKPTIKGTRIMVSNILSLLAGGYSIAQTLDYYPELREEDIKAAIEYAATVIDEETIFTSMGSQRPSGIGQEWSKRRRGLRTCGS